MKWPVMSYRTPFNETNFFLNLISPVGGYSTSANVILPGEALPNTLWINQEDSQLKLILEDHSATLLYHLYDNAVVLDAKNYFLDVSENSNFTEIINSQVPLGQLYRSAYFKHESITDINGLTISAQHLDLTVTDVEGKSHVETLSNLYETTLVEFTDNNQLATPETLTLEATINQLEIAPFKYVIE